MKKRLARALTILAFALGISAAPVLVAQTAQPAAAVSHNLAIKTHKGPPLTVCHHFEDNGTGATTSNTTKDCDGVHRLPAGEWSTQWWKDTDAVWLQGGYTLKADIFGPNPTVRGCRERAFLTKVSPNIFSGKAKLYRVPCDKYN